MSVIERVWVYIGRNGALSGVTPDEAQAQEIADQRPGLRAVEYVPAEQLTGAVEALQAIYDRHHMNGDGSAGKVSGDALRALGIDPDGAPASPSSHVPKEDG